MKGIAIVFLLALSIFSFSSCSWFNRITRSSKDVVGSETFSPLPGTRTLTRQLARSDLVTRSQTSGGVNAIRLVEVYERGQREGSAPRYRIFGVQPGSIYELLGIETADVLLGAEGRVIFEPNGFSTYVLSYLPNQSKAVIDIARLGQPYRMEYEIIGGGDS